MGLTQNTLHEQPCSQYPPSIPHASAQKDRTPMALILPRFTTAGDFVVPEAGVYSAEFDTYDGPKEGQFGTCIELTFKITNDEEYDGVALKRTYGWSMGSRSKLTGVISALMGNIVTQDDEINLDELIGTVVNINVINVEKPDRDNPKELRTWANIDSVSPVRRKKAKVAADVEPKASRASTLKGTAFDADDDDDE